MMLQADIQQVCENGHQVTDSYNRNVSLRKEFCTKCGAKTITRCEECDSPIKGYDWNSGVAYTVPVPEYCHKCGKPYPWTKKKKELKEKIDEIKQNIPKNPTIDKIDFIENLCKRFNFVTRKLLTHYKNKTPFEITDEYDVQYLFNALLALYFDDIRTEEWTPSYAGGSNRMDFLLKEESIVIEIKKTRKGLNASEIGNQLIIDIEHYKQHPRCKTLYCFIYDPDGLLNNPKGLENDLSFEKEGFAVKTIINP